MEMTLIRAREILGIENRNPNFVEIYENYQEKLQNNFELNLNNDDGISFDDQQDIETAYNFFCLAQYDQGTSENQSSPRSSISSSAPTTSSSISFSDDDIRIL